MTLAYADRVLETSTTTGTGTINLLGATTGFQTFIQGTADGAKVPYTIEDGQNWETGVGTVTAGTPDTLSRDTVVDSSAGGAPINWGPGTRNVFISASSHFMIWKDENGQFNDPDIIGAGNISDGAIEPEKMASAQFPLATSLRRDPAVKTISSGVLALDAQYNVFTIDTEGSAAADDLTNITTLAGTEWPVDSVIYLQTASSSRDVTITYPGAVGVGYIYPEAQVNMVMRDVNVIVRLQKVDVSLWIAALVAINGTAAAAEQRERLGIASATATAGGIVELATVAETLAGTDAVRALTAAGVAGTKSLATNGYYRFPGGFTIQWGSTTSTANPKSITFPIAFPTACRAVVASPATNADALCRPTSISTTGFDLYQSNAGTAVTWIAIGY